MTAQQAGRTARLGEGPSDSLLLPAGTWYVLFLLAPLVVLAVISLGVRSPTAGTHRR